MLYRVMRWNTEKGNNKLETFWYNEFLDQSIVYTIHQNMNVVLLKLLVLQCLEAGGTLQLHDVCSSKHGSHAAQSSCYLMYEFDGNWDFDAFYDSARWFYYTPFPITCNSKCVLNSNIASWGISFMHKKTMESCSKKKRLQKKTVCKICIRLVHDFVNQIQVQLLEF